MYRLCHENFRYLTKEEWESTICASPNDLSTLNRLSKFKFEKRVQRYSLKENIHLNPTNDVEDVRIVMLGKTGAGKSATANTILGFSAFKTEPLAVSVTAESKCVAGEVNGRVIKVMDTPGLHDTHHSKANVVEEIARITKIFPDGVHAFLYVRNITDTRFTKEERETLNQIETMFGGKMKRFRILVYTYAEGQLYDKSLQAYCDFQKQDETKGITQFLKDLGSNIVAVNNNTTTPAEQQRNQNAILALVDKVKRANGGSVYTSEMFAKAMEKHEKLQYNKANRRYSPGLRNAVGMFIAADPGIVFRERELEKKVYQFQLKKVESDLQRNFSRQLEGMMNDIYTETKRIKELQEKEMSSNEQSKRKRRETERVYLAKFEAKVERQETYQEEEKRKLEDDRRSLQQYKMGERNRFTVVKRRQRECFVEMASTYEGESQNLTEEMLKVQKRKTWFGVNVKAELTQPLMEQRSELRLGPTPIRMERSLSPGSDTFPVCPLRIPECPICYKGSYRTEAPFVVRKWPKF